MTTATTPFELEPRTETARAPARAEGAAHGAPRALLRLEGALTLITAVAAYHAMGGSWGWLAALFLLPDLSMLGYLAGPRLGAAAYNAGHSHVAPAALAAVALALGAPQWALLGALIWVAHIGFDRMLGYGLKYDRFGATHLGHLGR